MGSRLREGPGQTLAKTDRTDASVLARFAGHLASWAGMCPGNDESAGKRRLGKTTKDSEWLGGALTEAAHAAARTEGSYLLARYAGIKGRRGSKKAAVAVGHSISWLSATTC